MNTTGARLNPSIEGIVEACKYVFGRSLRCVILKGSALTGDFIPNYSDVDIHAYVESSVLEDDKTPKLEFVLKFQEAIGQLEPREAGVSQFQVYFLRADKKIERWSPPIAGSYKILYGAPVSAMEVTSLHEYIEGEWSYLGEARRYRLDLLGRFIDKPNSSIPALVRLTGTCLKGLLYALSSVLSRDPERAFSSPLNQLLSDICDQVPDLSYAINFFEAVRDWPEVEKDPGKAREVFSYGIRALEVIEKWHASKPGFAGP